MEPTGRNTYREGVEAKPCGIDSKTSGFVLKPIRFALPAWGLGLFSHGFGPELSRIDVTANIFGSFPCGNESLSHRNDLQQVLWNQWMQRCPILSIDIEPLSIDIEPLPIDIEPLSIDIEPLSIDIEPLSIDIEPLSIDIEPLPIDIEPLPHRFDSFPYRFNRTTTGFQPSTIAFVLKTSDAPLLRMRTCE